MRNLIAIKTWLGNFLRYIRGPSTERVLRDFEVVGTAKCMITSRYNILVSIERKEYQQVYKRPYISDKKQFVYRVKSEMVGDGPVSVKEACKVINTFPPVNTNCISDCDKSQAVLNAHLDTIIDRLQTQQSPVST